MAHFMKPINNFADKIQTILSQGTDGSGQKQNYVPYSALEDYWHIDGISEVLNSFPGASQNVIADTVREQRLRIFSILAYCTKQGAFRIGYIKKFIDNNFDDHNLPLDDQHPVSLKIFPNNEEGREARRAFNEHQFLFSPFPLGQDFPHDRTLAEGRLLPWKPGNILSKDANNTTIVQLYTINSDCKLHEEVQKIAVKKTRLRHRNGQPNKDAEETFTNELETYGALHNRFEWWKCQDHFLKYHGSFKQGGWGYLLLEYADERSLEQFYSRNNTPHDPSEMHNLWEAMFNLLDGLSILHHLDKNITNSILQGIHQDLKPSNIFVFKVHTDKLGYKYRFKIGDFGLSSIRRRKAIHPDNKGTTMYGAPELTTPIPDHRDLDFGATPKVDIWSMGCIYFEMLVWVTCGERGRDEFLSMRVNEGGSEAAFHNHRDGLMALDRMLELLLSRQRIFDHLTQPIAERIKRSMLHSEPTYRLDAHYLLEEFRDVLKKAKEDGEIAVRAETPVSGAGVRYQQHLGGRHGRPSPPQSRGADKNHFSGPSYSPPAAAASLESTQGALGIMETPDSNSREAARARRSPPERAREQGPRLRVQTTGPGQDMTSFETTRSPTRTNTYCGTDASPSANRPNPDNRARPSPGNHRVPAPGGTAVRSPRQSNQFAPCSISTDIAGSAGSSGQSLIRGNDHRQDPRPRSRRFGKTLQAAFNGPLLSQDASREAIRRANSSRSTGGENFGQSAGGEEWSAKPSARDILEYKRKKKAKELPENFKLPGQVDALKYQENRDQIFVHDDSKTMFEHMSDVLDMVEALSYLVKGCDDNGVELIPISQPKNPIKDKKDATSKIVKHLKGLKAPSSQNDHIERNFGQILDKVKGMKADTGSIVSRLSLAPRSQPEEEQADVTMYVLTDGMWDDDDENGCPAIAVPIRNLIRQMKQNHRDRTDIMIQFIQFGNDKKGTERLRYLDNKLSSEPGMKDYDIIDRKPFDSNIWEILIGSLNRKNDGGDSDDEQEFHDAKDEYSDEGGGARLGGIPQQPRGSSQCGGGAAQPRRNSQYGGGGQYQDNNGNGMRQRGDQSAHSRWISSGPSTSTRQDSQISPALGHHPSCPWPQTRRRCNCRPGEGY